MTKLWMLLLLLAQYTLPVHLTTTGKQPVPLNACLVSAWPMTEGSGLTLSDISGHANTATINTGASVTWGSYAGLPGTTPQWNGSGYALATSSSLTNFDGTTPFSASAWIVPGSATVYAMMGSLESGSGFKGWEFATTPNSGIETLDFFLINNYPSNAIDVHGSTGGSALTLYYVVVTYDGSQLASGVKMYANGTLLTNSVLTNTLTSSTATGTPLRIGGRDNSTDFYDGDMSYMEVYNCVLTSTVVSNYYSNGPGIY